MTINDKTLKRLGFKPKAKNRNELQVDVEVSKHEYISISIIKNNDTWSFSGIEIQGEQADIVRKKVFKTFSMEEIIEFLNQY
jgi:hypothetical protein